MDKPEAAKSSGEATGVARKEVERRNVKSVITSKNATELDQVVIDLIEWVVDDGENWYIFKVWGYKKYRKLANLKSHPSGKGDCDVCHLNYTTFI